MPLRELWYPKTAANTCRYAVKHGFLDEWHDCGREAVLVVDGDRYCPEHGRMLQDQKGK